MIPPPLFGGGAFRGEGGTRGRGCSRLQRPRRGGEHAASAYSILFQLPTAQDDPVIGGIPKPVAGGASFFWCAFRSLSPQGFG